MHKNTLLKTFVTAAISSAAFLCVGVHNAIAASFNSISRIYALPCDRAAMPLEK
jgi:hypothetical protein